MKRVRLATLFAAVACVALTAPIASAKGVGGYVGFSIGQASTDDLNAADIDSEFASIGIGTVTTVDDSDTAFRIFGGYQFNANLAVEGAYTDFGDFATFNSRVVSGGSGTASGGWSGSDLSAAALGILPIGESFELFGKAGIAFWDIDFIVSASGPGGSAALSDSDTGISPLIGFGARFNVGPMLAIRAEFERHLGVGDDETTGEGDVDIASIGVQISF